MATTKNKKTEFLVRLVTRRAVAVAYTGTILAALGFILTLLLYSNLRTDIEELLPDSAQSVKDLREMNSRLQSSENIVILVFSKNTVQSKKFIEDLARGLEGQPKSKVARVEYRINQELQFFKDRQALFIDLGELLKIKDYVKKRIEYETNLARKRPAGLEPKLDYGNILKAASNKFAEYDRFPDGYFATPDEKIRSLVVYVPGKGLEAAQAMKAAIVTEVTRLHPQNYAPDLEVKYTGNVQNMLEESAALVEDLILSTVIVTILVIFAMLIFYRSVWATFLLVLSLFMGTFWTFGFAYIAVGYLNANTAFLASIVIGNGINFGIIFLARYLEERRREKRNVEAIRVAINNTMTATATAALAAGLSYGSLILTGFRGFSQFGVIGLIGMILCWISAYTLLPAFLTILDVRLKHKWISPRPPRPLFSHIVAGFVGRVPRLVVTLTLVAVLLSGYAFVKNHGEELIETDLSKLRDRTSMTTGSGALYHYIEDIFGHSFSPMVILSENREAAQKVAALFREQQAKEGKGTLITSVESMDDFLPDDQREKTKVIAAIGDLLSPDILARLNPQERKLADIFLSKAAAIPFREKDLPPMLTVRFKESNGSVGTAVLVDKKIEVGGDSSEALTRFVSEGRQIAYRVNPYTPVAGGLPLSYDMYKAVVNDGPKATLFAFLAVVILVIILFRSAGVIALTLFALILGVFWLAALILDFHLKINFLNFIALPITFGIGVDYGVNVLQRYLQDGKENIVKVIQNTGGAVMLCSLTTIIGYSSLLIAGNQAFVSFGRLAVLGEVTCVTAAVISLPAFLVCFGRHRKSAQREKAQSS